MNEEKLSQILMDGIDDMHKIMRNVGKKDFNEEEAKIKIATNNSLTTTAKTLIQLEMLKLAAKTARKKDGEETKKLLKVD